MDDAYEETGWKLVHGDIFRPPQHRAFFVANLGAGIQLVAMSVSFRWTDQDSDILVCLGPKMDVVKF